MLLQGWPCGSAPVRRPSWAVAAKAKRRHAGRIYFWPWARAEAYLVTSPGFTAKASLQPLPAPLSRLAGTSRQTVNRNFAWPLPWASQFGLRENGSLDFQDPLRRHFLPLAANDQGKVYRPHRFAQGKDTLLATTPRDSGPGGPWPWKKGRQAGNLCLRRFNIWRPIPGGGGNTKSLAAGAKIGPWPNKRGL